MYRKHSRKKSSQVIVPPIQVSRRRSVRKHNLDESHHSIADSPTSTLSSGGGVGAQPPVSSDSSSPVPENSPSDFTAANASHEKSINDAVTASTSETSDIDDEDEDEDLYVDGSGKKRSSTVSINTVTSGVTTLVGAQFLSKMLTFSLNHVVLRLVSPSVMGTNYQFEFVVNSILFFSREAVRLAAQRQTLSHKAPDPYRFEGGVVNGTRSGTIQQVVNIGFVPILFGVPFSVAILWIYHVFSGRSAANMAYFTPAVFLYGASCIIELASEPSYLLAQLLSDFKIRASAETVAVFVRCVLTFMFVFLASKSPQLSDSYILAFALGQLAYSLVLSSIFIFNAARVCRHQPYSMWSPCKVFSHTDSTSWTHVDPATSHLALGMWLQTLFKHCLTEGDRLLVSLLLPISEQGVYALVANYGSLLARLCFLPIEETLRNYFSKLLTTDTAPSVQPLPTSPDLASPQSPVVSVFKSSSSSSQQQQKFPEDETSGSDTDRPVSTLQEAKDRSVSSTSDSTTAESVTSSTTPTASSTTIALDAQQKQSILVLSTVLRCYIYLGFFASLFGPLCSEYVLCLLVTSDWLISGASSVLSAYALYIPFLALNGSLEAFVQSVASVADLRRQGLVMIAFSLVFGIAAYLTMHVAKMGAVGLVYANILNMALRIVWCASFIHRYYSSWEWLSMSIPKLPSLSAGVIASAVALRIGHVYSAAELGQHIALAGVTALVIAYCERDLVLSALSRK